MKPTQAVNHHTMGQKTFRNRIPITMAIRVVKFSNGGYKIRKCFATYPKEIIDF
jgi:hypothetical protein